MFSESISKSTSTRRADMDHKFLSTRESSQFSPVRVLSYFSKVHHEFWQSTCVLIGCEHDRRWARRTIQDSLPVERIVAHSPITETSTESKRRTLTRPFSTTHGKHSSLTLTSDFMQTAKVVGQPSQIRNVPKDAPHIRLRGLVIAVSWARIIR